MENTTAETQQERWWHPDAAHVVDRDIYRKHLSVLFGTMRCLESWRRKNRLFTNLWVSLTTDSCFHPSHWTFDQFTPVLNQMVTREKAGSNYWKADSTLLARELLVRSSSTAWWRQHFLGVVVYPVWFWSCCCSKLDCHLARDNSIWILDDENSYCLLCSTSVAQF